MINLRPFCHFIPLVIKKGKKKFQKQMARKKECIAEDAEFGQIRTAADEQEGKDLSGYKK